MGIVSPVGSQLDEAWRNVREGRSGIDLLDDFDTSSFPTRIGGAVRGFNIDAYLTPKEARKNDPFIHYGVAASVDAIRVERRMPDRRIAGLWRGGRDSNPTFGKRDASNFRRLRA